MESEDTPLRTPRSLRAVSSGMAARATPASARVAIDTRTRRDGDLRGGRARRIARLRGLTAENPSRAAWLLGALALVLYLATLAHGVTWDDAGELAAGVAQLGVVHPTGYPTYVLLGHVFTLAVPFGDRATQANAWSAV